MIISYDGTENDDDALALGKLLAQPGELALAYIRHSKEIDPEREKVAQHDAERRLAQGAELLGRPEIPQHVVFGASTGAALEELAETRRGLDRRLRLGLPHSAGPRRAADLRPAAARDRRHGGRDRRLRAARRPGAAIATIAVVSTDGDDTARARPRHSPARRGAQVVANGREPT